MSEADFPASADHVVVTFALPDESRPFVAGCTGGVLGKRRVGAPDLPTLVGRQDGKKISVVHTGVGDTPAGRERLKTVLGSADAAPRWVISAGYAGGLRPDIRAGELVLGENFSDARLAVAARQLLVGEPLHVGALTSQPIMAESADAKSALAAETSALAVDMETQWIAHVCASAGVPMLSLRVISDAADQPFPVPGHILFDAARQRPRYVALPVWLLAHPRRIAPFAGFVRGLGPARTRLAHALRILVAGL